MSQIQDKSKGNLFQGFGALIERQVKDWYKSPFLFILTLAQPVVWIFFYGKAFPLRSVPGISSSYFSFLSAGMIGFVILFASVYSGMAIVFDRQSGFLKKMIVTSVSRASIIMSYVISTLFKALVQAAILLAVAILLGMQSSHLTALGLVGAFVAEALLAIGLSAFFTMVGILSGNPNIQLGIMSFISLPLLFASNSLFPSSSMPIWLQYITKINPLSYANDAARQSLLGLTSMASLSVDFAALSAFAVLFSLFSVILSLGFLSK